MTLYDTYKFMALNDLLQSHESAKVTEFNAQCTHVLTSGPARISLSLLFRFPLSPLISSTHLYVQSIQ